MHYSRPCSGSIVHVKGVCPELGHFICDLHNVNKIASPHFFFMIILFFNPFGDCIFKNLDGVKVLTSESPYIQKIFGAGRLKCQNLIIGLSNQPSYLTRVRHHIKAGMLMLHSSAAEPPVSRSLAQHILISPTASCDPISSNVLCHAGKLFH